MHFSRSVLLAWLCALAAVLGGRPAAAQIPLDVCGPNADPCVVSTTVTINDDSIIDVGSRKLQITGTGRLVVNTMNLLIRAGTLEVQPGGRITGVGSVFDFQTSGDIIVAGTGSTRGLVDVSSPSLDGTIGFTAGGSITISGRVAATGTDVFAYGGTIDMDAGGAITVTSNGQVDLSSGNAGAGGELGMRGNGSVLVDGFLDVAGSDDGGGSIDILSRNGDARVGVADISGGGLGGDGGDLTLTAAGSVKLLGAVNGAAASDGETGGGGASITISAGTTVTIAGTLTLTGAIPDGLGGSVDVTTNGSVAVTAPIIVDGNGTFGCAGEVSIVAGDAGVSLGKISAKSGQCDDEGLITVKTTGPFIGNDPVVVDGAASMLGGRIDITGGSIAISSVYRAAGAAGQAGTIALTACTVNVTHTAELRAPGGKGVIGIRASGQATVAGTIDTTGGAPSFIGIGYLDPAHPPVLTGSTIAPPPLVGVDSTLSPCAVVTPVCGDGIVNGTDQCDDGNTNACDGCSATCTVEACGNGVLDCNEECDLGNRNGKVGSTCSSTCKNVVVELGLQRVAGRQERTGCLMEWVVRNPHGLDQTAAVPITACIDGDPLCDLDGTTNGSCTFDVRGCLAVNDANRPACTSPGVSEVKLVKPDPRKTTDPVDLQNVSSLRTALAATGVNVKVGNTILDAGPGVKQRDVCSATAPVKVPVSTTHIFQVGAKDLSRRRMRRNAVALTCQNNNAVCGNGILELGEQCDDGNRRACDGCSPTCKEESCGDGIVACGEECDEGPNNGKPGGQCTSSCKYVVPDVRIPGGGNGPQDCLVEWSMDLATPAAGKDGLPGNIQTCKDGDPTCDIDPRPGICGFALWACFGGADPRISCVAQDVGQPLILAPSTKFPGPAADLRYALMAEIVRLGFPSSAGERCTRRLQAIGVLAGRSERVGIKLGPTNRGKPDRDMLKLVCQPAQ